jgi:Spy/CpxP family protein refolding chaperone
MKGIRILVVVSLLTASATLSFAQQAAGPAVPGGQHNDAREADNPTLRGRDGDLSEKKRKELRKKVDAVRIWKLTEELKLDADASAKLSALLSSLDQKRMDIQREQRESLRSLRQSLQSPTPSESKVKSDLEKLEKNHHAMEELRSKEMNGLKKVLTVEQQARYLLFQQEFRNEMRGMIEGARGLRQDKVERGARAGKRNDRMREGPGEPPESR